MLPILATVSLLAPSTSQEFNLQELVDRVRTESGVPALAVGVTSAGRIDAIAVSGMRSLAEDSTPVESEDRWHVGSLSKAMTSSMIARLVEDGRLDWDLTVGEVLADLDPWPEYGESTILQVLQHRAGLPEHRQLDPADSERLRTLPGTSTDTREVYVAEVLGADPLGTGTFRYSNAGYSVAALMVERLTGQSWEDLMQEQLFDALRMTKSGIGWPASSERPDQPRGHFLEEGGARPQGLDEYTFGTFMAPAGDAHTSVRDLARFALAHLNGLQGREDFLLPATVRRLHEPLPGGPYACGWLVRGGVHSHSGSAGTFFAVMELVPEEDRGFVLITNVVDFQGVTVNAIRAGLAER